VSKKKNNQRRRKRRQVNAGKLSLFSIQNIMFFLNNRL
jgi:hypothetical protein